LAATLGWALVEPDASETLPSWATCLALPFALVWIRALLRAGRALRACPPVAMAVGGLLRPRLIVSEAFQRAADADAFGAALLHERAHALHRDPLRIWLAQLATDLQWPGRRATGRLAAWREALELARDEEARLLGADGADLAAAILCAARLEMAPRSVTAAAVHDGAASVGQRVRRLLTEMPAHLGKRAVTLLHASALAAGVVLAMVTGSAWGERFLRAALTL
jgi:hypothetical protein